MSHMYHPSHILSPYKTIYSAWTTMKQRCYNPNVKEFKNYGGRGIKVCERWLNSFPNFLEDLGCKPTKQHSLDRINNDGDYEPGNCRWATRDIQLANRRPRRPGRYEHNGIFKFAHQWAKDLSITKNCFTSRIRKGWSMDKIINTPKKKWTKRS